VVTGEMAVPAGDRWDSWHGRELMMMQEWQEWLELPNELYSLFLQRVLLP
jgi:hypothetical protein